MVLLLDEWNVDVDLEAKLAAIEWDFTWHEPYGEFKTLLLPRGTTSK